MGCVLVANNGVTEHVTCPLWGHARDDNASQKKKMAVKKSNTAEITILAQLQHSFVCNYCKIKELVIKIELVTQLQSTMGKCFLMPNHQFDP